MKRFILISSLLAGFSTAALSQLTLKGYTLAYGSAPTDKAPVIAVATSSANPTDYTDALGELPVIVREGRSAGLIVQQVFDTSSSHFFVRNLTPAQAANYEFRILEDGKDAIMPWASYSTANTSSLSYKDAVMTYLGAYKTTHGQYLLVDMRKKGGDSIISSAIVFYRKIQPVIGNIFLGDELNKFLKKLSEPNEKGVDSSEFRKWKREYQPADLDTRTGLPKKLLLQPDENSVIFFLNVQVKKASDLEYQSIRNGEVYRDWKQNDFDNGFIWLNKLPPGDYQLKMRFSIQPENVTAYPFEVGSRWDQTLSFKFIAGGLIAAFFGFIVMLFRSRRQRQRLRWSRARQERAEIELRSIYAQLNPHFIFNALSSIQGLVNKKETEKANHYISTFSNLLRDSLVNGEKDSVSLESEIRVLDTYLQLEQLRFGFQYSINVAEGINTRSIEMPPLLLQPLVENAIKHGIASHYENGKILIAFTKDRDDLLAEIADNGKGFDPQVATSGFGLKLTRQRIRLMNETGDGDAVLMAIQSGKEGTTIQLRFKNLLS